MDMQERSALSTPRDVERRVLLALQGIRYGSVEVIIHDSKLLQIQPKEKVPIEAQPL